MTLAESVIADLDNALAEVGQSVTLERMQLVAGVQSAAVSTTCTAVLRAYQPQEIVEGIIQGDSLVILSPTPLTDAAWPPRKGDRVLAQSKARTVQSVTPYYVGDTLVRLELQVRG